MNCPICTEAMESGTAFLEKTWLGAMVVGFGTRDLYFKSEEGKKQRAMNAWSHCEAFKCQSCGAFLVATEKKK